MTGGESLIEGVRQDLETHIALREAFLSIMKQKPEKRWCHEVSPHAGHNWRESGRHFSCSGARS